MDDADRAKERVRNLIVSCLWRSRRAWCTVLLMLACDGNARGGEGDVGNRIVENLV